MIDFEWSGGLSDTVSSIAGWLSRFRLPSYACSSGQIHSEARARACVLMDKHIFPPREPDPGQTTQRGIRLLPLRVQLASTATMRV
jgi:hypothetical protein